MTEHVLYGAWPEERPGFTHVPSLSSTDLPIRSDSVDYFCAGDGLRGVSDRVAFMNEVVRVCRDGAVIALRPSMDMTVSRQLANSSWYPNDLFAFDARQPGYEAPTRALGFRGCLELLSGDLVDDGTGLRFECSFRVVKDARAQELVRERHIPVIPKQTDAPEVKFSIIVPHYEGTISTNVFDRGLASLQSQTLQDYEILCYHDGPRLRNDPLRVEPNCTDYRRNDWGHSLRDAGIREARGEYLLFFNPDSVLYPHALAALASGDADILVYPIQMVGVYQDGDHLRYDEPRDESKSFLMHGDPIAFGSIDCMQFVMRRDRWREAGGWFDKRECSDGFMFASFARRFAVEYISNGEPLGEHW